MLDIVLTSLFVDNVKLCKPLGVVAIVNDYRFDNETLNQTTAEITKFKVKL